jgi:transketolase
MRNAFAHTLIEEAEKNNSVWLLNADLGFSVLEPFAEKFPERYLNVGIAEQNMAGIAAGLGMNGCTPFMYSIGNFPTLRCFEQIRNDICYHGADAKVVSVGAGFAYGAQGYTHHAIEDLAAMKLLPNMVVCSPCDPVETAAMVRMMCRNKKPSYLRLGRAGEPVFHEGDWQDEDLLRPHIVAPGEHTFVLATGGILGEALEARRMLQEKGQTMAVASIPLFKPVDENTLLSLVDGYDEIYTLEEHSIVGGLYETLLPLLTKTIRAEKITPFAVHDGATKGIIGDMGYMRAHCGINAKAIYQRAAGKGA